MQDFQPTIQLTRIRCYDDTDGQGSAVCPEPHLWTVVLRIDGHTVSVIPAASATVSPSGHVGSGEEVDIPA